jgi:hypothetical protein
MLSARFYSRHCYFVLMSTVLFLDPLPSAYCDSSDKVPFDRSLIVHSKGKSITISTRESNLNSDSVSLKNKTDDSKPKKLMHRKTIVATFESKHDTEPVHEDEDEEKLDDGNAAILFTVDPVEDEGTPEDIAWMASKMQCSFCRYFMNGPCKQQYKQWAKCVDRAEADGKNAERACKLYSSALFQCCATPVAIEYNTMVEKEARDGASDGQQQQEEADKDYDYGYDDDK